MSEEARSPEAAVEGFNADLPPGYIVRLERQPGELALAVFRANTETP